jgi:hypothetical protein
VKCVLRRKLARNDRKKTPHVWKGVLTQGKHKWEQHNCKRNFSNDYFKKISNVWEEKGWVTTPITQDNMYFQDVDGETANKQELQEQIDSIHDALKESAENLLVKREKPDRRFKISENIKLLIENRKRARELGKGDDILPVTQFPRPFTILNEQFNVFTNFESPIWFFSFHKQILS